MSEQGGWKAEIEWPAWALEKADVKANLRNVVAGRMRRGFLSIANAAASANPFKHIADRYEVHQEQSGNEIRFWIDNSDPHAVFVEEDIKPHMMPAQPPRWLPISAFLGWAARTGGNPYAAQASVAAHGTRSYMHPGSKGRHILQSAWDAQVGGVIENMQAGVDSVMLTWGAIAGAAE